MADERHFVRLVLGYIQKHGDVIEHAHASRILSDFEDMVAGRNPKSPAQPSVEVEAPAPGGGGESADAEGVLEE